jgi:hypothetical protein
MNFARVNFEVAALERNHSAKSLLNVLDVEEHWP